MATQAGEPSVSAAANRTAPHQAPLLGAGDREEAPRGARSPLPRLRHCILTAETCLLEAAATQASEGFLVLEPKSVTEVTFEAVGDVVRAWDTDAAGGGARAVTNPRAAPTCSALQPSLLACKF